MIARWFLQVDTQPEVGVEAYDQGAVILQDFFRKCLVKFLEPDLDPLGRRLSNVASMGAACKIMRC